MNSNISFIFQMGKGKDYPNDVLPIITGIYEKQFKNKWKYQG